MTLFTQHNFHWVILKSIKSQQVIKFFNSIFLLQCTVNKTSIFAMYFLCLDVPPILCARVKEEQHLDLNLQTRCREHMWKRFTLAVNLPEAGQLVVAMVPELLGISIQKWEVDVEGWGSSWARSRGAFVSITGSTDSDISEAGTGVRLWADLSMSKV